MSLPQITTRIAPLRPYLTRVEAKGQALQLGADRRAIAVTLVTTGLTGAPASASLAQLSSEPDNQLALGTDGKLLVPGGYDFDGLVAASLSL
jgi:hypothetical protein